MAKIHPELRGRTQAFSTSNPLHVDTELMDARDFKASILKSALLLFSRLDKLNARDGVQHSLDPSHWVGSCRVEHFLDHQL